MLQPGEKATVSITLLNTGEADNFRINIDTDASADEVDSLGYAVTPTVYVQQNMTAYIRIDIYLYYGAPTGLSVTFTLAAQSVNNIDVSDHITFDVTYMETVSGMQYNHWYVSLCNVIHRTAPVVHCCQTVK